MRQIEMIINGDDFGISQEVNEAIIRAHKNGVLTSCSLMVAGDAFEQAVRLAKENQKLAVGLHLVTVQGRAVLPPSDIPSIVDENGYFSNDPTLAGVKYFFGKRARREIKREIGAQFAKFAATGLNFSHVDSHLHMHVNPAVFSVSLEFCRRYHVNRMRVPKDDFGIACRLDPVTAIKNAPSALIFSLLCRHMKKRLRKEEFIFTDRVYGHFFTGRISKSVVLGTLGQTRAATNEFYLHPAIPREGRLMNGRLIQCKKEFDVLVSREVRNRISELGIKLTTYSELSGLHENQEFRSQTPAAPPRVRRGFERK